jgi:hypothetical protein
MPGFYPEIADVTTAGSGRIAGCAEAEIAMKRRLENVVTREEAVEEDDRQERDENEQRAAWPAASVRRLKEPGPIDIHSVR